MDNAPQESQRAEVRLLAEMLRQLENSLPRTRRFLVATSALGCLRTYLNMRQYKATFHKEEFSNKQKFTEQVENASQNRRGLKEYLIFLFWTPMRD